MELLLAALPGVVTTCLLVWVLAKVLERQNEERQSHRIEVDALNSAHAEQLAKLIDGQRREVANLCQRLQAPQIAVAEHVGQNTIADPIQPDLNDDLALLRERERELEQMSRDLELRAEDLAVEL